MAEATVLELLWLMLVLLLLLEPTEVDRDQLVGFVELTTTFRRIGNSYPTATCLLKKRVLVCLFVCVCSVSLLFCCVFAFCIEFLPEFVQQYFFLLQTQRMNDYGTLLATVEN